MGPVDVESQLSISIIQIPLLHVLNSNALLTVLNFLLHNPFSLPEYGRGCRGAVELCGGRRRLLEACRGWSVLLLKFEEGGKVGVAVSLGHLAGGVPAAVALTCNGNTFFRVTSQEAYLRYVFFNR